MSKRVLIIDDEENIRQMTRLTLETAGYEVVEAESGIEAFAILGSGVSWDVILLDQKMPGLTGIEVLRRLRVLAPSARTIMVTAFASVELAVAAMKLGATDFVRKPMTPETVRNAVAGALAKATKSPKAIVNEVDEGQTSRKRTMTLNGFTILRPADVLGLLPQRPNERSFLVRRPDGREQQVVVTITEEAINSAARATQHLSLEEAFWTEQAERFLSDFIWNDGNIPLNGKLTLKSVEAEELEKASGKGDDR